MQSVVIASALRIAARFKRSRSLADRHERIGSGVPSLAPKPTDDGQVVHFGKLHMGTNYT